MLIYMLLVVGSAYGQNGLPFKTPKERGWQEPIVMTSQDMRVLTPCCGYVIEWGTRSIVDSSLTVAEIFKDNHGKMNWQHGEACFLLDEMHHWEYFPCKEYDRLRMKIIRKYQKEHNIK